MNKKTNTFYCFSPPVMIATFLIEMSLFVYTLVRYKLTPVTRLASAILLMLALFQLSEYNVCEGFGLSASVWSRVGFAAITLLPPLGLHLIHTIAKRKANWVVRLNYLMAASLVITFLFANVFVNHVCTGNYVIFKLADSVGGIYFYYYYIWLAVGIVLGLYYGLKATKYHRQALYLMSVGYLTFLLPTTLVNNINPQTVSGIPSIMCGFAVTYAIILVFGVVPLAKKR